VEVCLSGEEANDLEGKGCLFPFPGLIPGDDASAAVDGRLEATPEVEMSATPRAILDTTSWLVFLAFRHFTHLRHFVRHQITTSADNFGLFPHF
jgi:hypothetical protein